MFGGESFYLDGGAKDYLTSFDSVEYCKSYFESNHVELDINWAQIADRDTFKILLYGQTYRSGIFKWVEDEDDL